MHKVGRNSANLNNLVVKTKIRQTQRNADANAEASKMAEAKMETAVRPKIRIFAKTENLA